MSAQNYYYHHKLILIAGIEAALAEHGVSYSRNSLKAARCLKAWANEFFEDHDGYDCLKDEIITWASIDYAEIVKVEENIHKHLKLVVYETFSLFLVGAKQIDLDDRYLDALAKEFARISGGSQ